ncbi:MAG: J domain-containing protein [Eubacteriales bacterium]
MNYYEILEVSEKASDEVIKNAYKALVKKYHPDTYTGDKNFADKKIKEINNAFETLSDKLLKEIYDLKLQNSKVIPPNDFASPEPKTEHTDENKLNGNIKHKKIIRIF